MAPSKKLALLLSLFAFPVQVLAQGPRSPLEAFFPPAEARPKEKDETTRGVKTTLTLLRRGSSSDRVRERAKLMHDSETVVPVLVDELGRNQIVDFQIGLVLMELRDPRARTALERLTEEKGHSGIAGLALGKLGDPRSEGSLVKLVKVDPRAEWKRCGMLGLGRLRTETAAATLEGLVKGRQQDLDRCAALLALGWCGEARGSKAVQEAARDSSDPVRRAAAAALAWSRAWGELLPLTQDQDPMVRRIALEGLALAPADAQFFEVVARTRESSRRVNDLEEGRWLLAAAAVGGAKAEDLVAAAMKSEKWELRAAAAAAAPLVGATTEARVREAIGDPRPDVRAVALLTWIARGARQGSGVDPAFYAGHGDVPLSHAAVLGSVYLKGAGAITDLEKFQETTYRDDVRQLAREMAGWVQRDADAARELARARLQVLLDQTDWAVSWNLVASTHQLVLRVLGIENAVSRGGGGASPSGSAGARSAGAAALRVAPEDEDLKLHLDLFPYMDVRERIEFEPAARGQGR